MINQEFAVIEGDINAAQKMVADISEIFRRYDELSSDKTKNCVTAITAVVGLVKGLHIALAQSLDIPREVILYNFDKIITQLRADIFNNTLPAPSNETDPYKH